MILHAEGNLKMGWFFGLLTRNDYLLAFGVLKMNKSHKRGFKRMGMVLVVVGCAVK